MSRQNDIKRAARTLQAQNPGMTFMQARAQVTATLAAATTPAPTVPAAAQNPTTDPRLVPMLDVAAGHVSVAEWNHLTAGPYETPVFRALPDTPVGDTVYTVYVYVNDDAINDERLTPTWVSDEFPRLLDVLAWAAERGACWIRLDADGILIPGYWTIDGLVCRRPGCDTIYPEAGDGWDGYCGNCADLVTAHEDGEHARPHQGCPACDTSTPPAPVVAADPADTTSGDPAHQDGSAALNALIDQGLTFADVVTAFAARRTPEDLMHVQLAKDIWYREGEIEVDDNAIAAGSTDDGDYVLAWVWVDTPEDA